MSASAVRRRRLTLSLRVRSSLAPAGVRGLEGRPAASRRLFLGRGPVCQSRAAAAGGASAGRRGSPNHPAGAPSSRALGTTGSLNRCALCGRRGGLRGLGAALGLPPTPPPPDASLRGVQTAGDSGPERRPAAPAGASSKGGAERSGAEPWAPGARTTTQPPTAGAARKGTTAQPAPRPSDAPCLRPRPR